MTQTATRFRLRSRAFWAHGILGALCSTLAAVSCHSPTITLTTLADGGPGSLRDAIRQANSEVDHIQGLTILLPALGSGVYELSSCGSDDTNDAGDLDISILDKPVILQGTGANVVIKQTCAGERVLHQLGTGLLTLRNVTITGGSVTNDGSNPAEGGGVYANSEVLLESATISGNYVGSDVDLTAVGGFAGARGGGIYARDLRSRGSVIANNIASRHYTAPAEGGGVFVAGNVFISGGSITGNVARGGGQLSPTAAQPAAGGGIAQRSTRNAPVVLDGTHLADNAAVGHHGGSASGGAVSGGEVTAIQVTAVRNRARGGSASSLFNLPDLPAGGGSGGAISGSYVSVRNSTFSLNSAAGGDAGGVQHTGPLRPSNGGAIASGGGVDASASTFTQNSVQQGRGDDGYAFGVPAGGAIYAGTYVLLVNSTAHANRSLDSTVQCSSTQPNTCVWASVPGSGAALAASSLSFHFATITDNEGRDALATGWLYTLASVVLAPGGNVCQFRPSNAGSSYDWFSDATCGINGPGDVENGALDVLGPLADNGGMVQTRAPLPRSGLIDVVPRDACLEAHDARGVERPQRSACDVGAVEVLR